MQWCTLQTDVTSANGGGGWRGGQASFTLPEFKSKWLSCSFCIFFQSALSGKIFQSPGLCSLKTHFYGLLRGLCWVLRMAEVLDVREIANCTSPKLDLGLKMPEPLSPSSRPSFSFCQGLQFFMKGSWIPPSLKTHGPEQWRSHQKCEISTQETHVKNL